MTRIETQHIPPAARWLMRKCPRNGCGRGPYDPVYCDIVSPEPVTVLRSDLAASRSPSTP